MLAQFLETVQEALVEGAVGLSLALELLLLGLVLTGRSGHDRRLVDKVLELFFLGRGGIEFGTNRQRDALGFDVEPCPNRGKLIAYLEHLRMAVAQLGSQFGGLPGEFDVLDSQRRQRRVSRDFRDVRQFAGVEAGLAEGDQTGLLLDASAPGRRVAGVEFRHRLGRNRPLRTAGQALVAPIGGHRLFGDLQIAAQFGQALLEPLCRLPVRLVLGVDLIGEIGFRDRVGDARRHDAIGAFDSDEDDEGTAHQSDAQASGNGTDRRLPPRVAGVRARRRPRLGGLGRRLRLSRS